MGQYLCFVKGSWDLGVRFLMKGTDPVLKSLAEKEAALPTKSPEWLAPGGTGGGTCRRRKKHAPQDPGLGPCEPALRDSLEGATSLQRIKIEKRLDAASQIVPSHGGH